MGGVSDFRHLILLSFNHEAPLTRQWWVSDKADLVAARFYRSYARISDNETDGMIRVLSQIMKLN